ncbi:DNA repair helicase rad3 [Nitzschia inconspicua]|uniref:DNA repair helicase rad3 n=1 Tax=Nitzschia inconspicua TaxID=303405 RepID=A0A9K3PF17_9STRA|nr:DNA repair helicase rad3 [Nitzschia inconspicua]
MEGAVSAETSNTTFVAVRQNLHGSSQVTPSPNKRPPVSSLTAIATSPDTGIITGKAVENDAMQQVEQDYARLREVHGATPDPNHPVKNRPIRSLIGLTESPQIDVQQKKHKKQPSTPTSSYCSPEIAVLDPKQVKKMGCYRHDPSVRQCENDDEELKIISSTATNPNIVYPHSRTDCGVYPMDVNAAMFCKNCFCVLCEVRAEDCKQWAEHCMAPRPRPSKTKIINTDDVLLESPTTTARNVNTLYMQGHDDMYSDFFDCDDDDDDEVNMSTVANVARSRSEGRDDRLNKDRQQQQHQRSHQQPNYSDDDQSANMRDRNNHRDPKTMSIQDILSRKLGQALKFDEGGRTLLEGGTIGKTQATTSVICSMDGDIPQLKLTTFFMEGVKIGWPFPTVLQPQRQMAMHIIKALKRKRHVVIESPTGTGKSAAILCSVLAWQRYHMQSHCTTDEDDMALDTAGNTAYKSVPKIIYCSRTQSQVAQMVSSLKKTPYRPRMAVLGSRDRLCIHKDFTGKNKSAKISINNECQLRRQKTDLYRKQNLKYEGFYDDNDPPSLLRGDKLNHAHGWFPEADAAAAGDETNNHTKTPPTCPHFRQLTSDRTARLAADRFAGNPYRTKCCSHGGEDSTYGVHDLEDLTAFGKNPHLDNSVTIYRAEDGKFGMFLAANSQGTGCHIKEVKDTVQTGSCVKPGDTILTVNGANARGMSIDQVANEVRKTPADKPLRLTVLRHDADSSALSQSDMGDVEDEIYSDHAACPYYLSRALQSHADITFAPYNYVLDPSIRKVMGISLENTVVVLDEAHNVEGTLSDGGSGKYGEIDLCHVLCALANHVAHPTATKMEMIGTNKLVGSDQVAHTLLLFVEKIVKHLGNLRQRFETSPGKAKLETEYRRYRKILDTHEEELSYDGPTGYGSKGTPVGCMPFFTNLGISTTEIEFLLQQALSLEESLSGRDRDSDIDASSVPSLNNGKDQNSSIDLSSLVSMLTNISLAIKNPEHFYISCVAQANGNLDHAFGIGAGENDNGRRWRKDPRTLPTVVPKSISNPTGIGPACSQLPCRERSHGYKRVHHGDFGVESTPKWECHLILKLLSPGVLLKNIAHSSRSLILASGSLAPLPSLCAELELYGDASSTYFHAAKNHLQNHTSLQSPALTKSNFAGRLQTQPPPLEANHVIDLKKQLLAVSVGHFPNGERLTVTYQHFREPSFFPKLGAAIASVVECIPSGGVLVFLPSYSFLDRCVSSWSEIEIWSRLTRSKGKIIVEPTKSQEDFKKARDDFHDTIKNTGKCLLLAVFRGKMSEGISFNDEFARGVICVGMPYPNARDRGVIAKKNYNDEQRKLRKNTNLLPGMEWYSQQAYRAIAQALGRCIRHQADYGTIILMDSRHCDDGSPNDGVCRAHQNMPKWMRHSIRTLCMRPNTGGGSVQKPILGGYAGLQQEMNSFFAQCPAVSQTVRDKWKTELELARTKARQSSGHVFNKQTGSWTTRLPKLVEQEKNVNNNVKEEILT